MFKSIGKSSIDSNQERNISASIHTPENPYCSNPMCWCHTSAGYHDRILGLQEYSEEEVSEALKFWEICNS